MIILIYQCFSYYVAYRIIDPPVITSDIPQTVTIMPGDEFTIACEATGNPLPNIFWARNDEQIILGT